MALQDKHPEHQVPPSFSLDLVKEAEYKEESDHYTQNTLKLST